MSTNSIFWSFTAWPMKAPLPKRPSLPQGLGLGHLGDDQGDGASWGIRRSDTSESVSPYRCCASFDFVRGARTRLDEVRCWKITIFYRFWEKSRPLIEHHQLVSTSA